MKDTQEDTGVLMTSSLVTKAMYTLRIKKFNFRRMIRVKEKASIDEFIYELNATFTVNM